MDEQIRFENHLGETLTGTLHRPDAGKAGQGVVLGHCFTCSRHTGILRELAGALNRAGFLALRFDFSGNGQSQGAFVESTYSKQIEEMGIAVERLRSEGANWIGLAGHSLGAVVSVLTAADHSAVGAVCALAGRISGLTPMHFLSARQKAELEQTGKVRFESRGRSLKLSKEFFADAGRFELPRIIGGLKIPLLVVHGDADEIIPVKEAYKARDANPDAVTLEIVQGADHMFSDRNQREKIAQQVAKWFERQRDQDSDR